MALMWLQNLENGGTDEGAPAGPGLLHPLLMLHVGRCLIPLTWILLTAAHVL